MSEFTKTMRDWRRMCNAFVKQYDNDCCKYCRLDHLKSCGAIWEIEEGTYGTIAEMVAAWAAENPEPQYPTWAEWLIERGLAEYKGMVFHEYREDGNYVTKFETVLSKAAYNPIPADIAEKLGLKPKGENGDA